MLRGAILTGLMLTGLAGLLIALLLGGLAGWLLILVVAGLLIGTSLFLPYVPDGDL